MTVPTRADIGKQHPGPYRALIALSEEAERSAAAATLTADQVSAWLTTVINAFNRVAITSRYHVGV